MLMKWLTLWKWPKNGRTAKMNSPSLTPNFDKACEGIEKSVFYSYRIQKFLKENKDADLVDVLNDLESLTTLFQGGFEEMKNNLGILK